MKRTRSQDRSPGWGRLQNPGLRVAGLRADIGFFNFPDTLVSDMCFRIHQQDSYISDYPLISIPQSQGVANRLIRLGCRDHFGRLWNLASLGFDAYRKVPDGVF